MNNPILYSKNKMNTGITIVIVNDASYITGGSGKIALSTAVALAEQGFHVILFSAIGNIKEEDALKKKGVDVICLNQQDILNDSIRVRAIVQGIYNLKAKREFERLLKSLSSKNTVIHFHAWTKALSSSLFDITAKYRFKLVITAHDYFLTCPTGSLFNFNTREICHLRPMSIGCIYCNCDSRKYSHKLWRVLRQCIQNCAVWKNSPIRLITISKLNRRIVAHYLGHYPVHLYNIENPIELNDSTPVNVQKNDTYFFIGRLSAEKGVDLFCEAISSLSLKGMVLGDGYLLPELKRKYPNIEFSGHVRMEDMGQMLRSSCRALIFPSLLYETDGLVIREVMSFGIPCIVPDRCAASERVIDGKTGYIFQSGNLESLKKAILKAHTEDISLMSDVIIQNFDRSKYSMDTHIDKLIHLYHDLLAGITV
jgi:glycosyltransferase involved in cell wall biosynthesis